MKKTLGTLIVVALLLSSLIPVFATEVQPTKASETTPALIQAGIDLAIKEWDEHDGKALSRLGKKNKFSKWQCGTGPGCDIGWCGAFIGYCFDTSAVPMADFRECVVLEDGRPFTVRASSVGKIYTGFENMERLTNIPKPGYIAVYGKQKGYAYYHVGLVTDVKDMGEGKYMVSTVEGNVTSRIKRYTYLYDSSDKMNNYTDTPDEYQTDPDTFYYEKHADNWRITTFCQTWF